ncbi:MAG: NADH-quinone oxidoreductase subunit A [Myxococcota bacterium]
MAEQYIPVLVAFLVVGSIALAMLLMAMYLGPYKPTEKKNEPFECGNPSEGTHRKRFGIKFYIVALLFILFDIEIAFIYPWAVHFKRFGWFGFAEMMLFILVLSVGLIYVWRKGALNWEE